MKFIFEKLVPLPMLELNLEHSAVWEAESFCFEPGKKYRVIAPSGKGKTSLLSTMYGLRKDYRGVMKIDGEDASGFSSKTWSHLRKNRISFIFQGLELFDDLTAMENIRIKNRITSAKDEAEIVEMAEQLGIGSFLDRKCGILSFGQRQRVAIIRALCQPFEYLLADECFSHIDHSNSRTAMDLIGRECATRDAGMVLTSLDQDAIDGFDETVIL